MASRPTHLPDFKTPPVTEVALSIQFNSLKNYQTVHAGLIWELFRKKFGRVQELAPIDSAFETFGSQLQQSNPMQHFKFQVLNGPPSTRLWFINSDDTQLIQFQPDRFAHNWRKVGDEDAYPRYETMRREFLAGVKKLKKFINDEGLGDFVPNQVEISYINHILSNGNENLPATVGKVFRCWNNKRYSPKLGEIELSRFQTKFVFSDSNGTPVGRLHATAEPISVNGIPTSQFTLMARGRPAKPTLKSIEEFIDAGREKIVIAFTEMTTPEMHERWGRKK